MEKIVSDLISFLAKISVVALVTFAYCTPLFVLLYVIIFRNTEMDTIINLKYYAITYVTVFISYYKWIENSIKKEEKDKNKGD
jgi:hypothetical protein